MNKQENSNNISYEDILNEKGMFIATPVGVSMLPMIRQGLDTVKLIKPVGRCEKYDVILYKRKNGVYVLHRIIKVKKQSYYLCGDNQVQIEKGVTDDMIIGVMEGFYREELYIPKDNSDYLKYVKRRVRSRKYRYCKWFIQKVINKLLRGNKNKDGK